MSHLAFGTDGWRALIAEDFTFANVRRVADALGQALPERSLIVVGYDHRFHSESFAKEAAAVLAAQKHRVTLHQHATTTPALSFSVRTLRAKAGVMITASHNPPLFNGFKVKLAPGCSADPAFTKQIEDTLKTDVPHAPLDFPRKTVSIDKSYLAFLLSKLERKFWRKAKAKVVADGMHGYGGVLWESLFEKLNLKGEVIRSRRDPLFGGVAPEPIEKNLAPLREAVLRNKAAIGLAVDGDGDRLGAVDEKGVYLPPHHIFPLVLLHLIENRRLSGKVVQTVSLGYLSERICKKHGIELMEVPVGFKYVVDKMRQAKVMWGGEESGGYGVGLWAMERDGLLSALLLLEYALAKKQPLSVLRQKMEAEFGKSVFLRHDYPMRHAITDKKKWSDTLSAKMPAKLADTKVRELRVTDGVKIILEDDSWLLLRPSGTEPLMRTYAESPSPEKTKQLLHKAQEFASMKAG
jgi:phosphomannomutase